MASMGMQMAGCASALFGWIGVLIVCGNPMWRVTAFIGNSIVLLQIMWEDIRMSCMVQSTGQMQCKVYGSVLALSPDLQGALVVASIITGVAGLLAAFAGGKCTNFIPAERAKARASVAAAVLLIISGLLCIIAVSWTASIIMRDFYNPLFPMALQELGISLSMTGVAGTILICALPMWKVTAFIGTHLVVMQVFWEGLWMTCVSEYTGQMQCKLYDALLDLSPDLQAARGLICISMVLGCLAFLIFLLGARCTNCLGHPQIKARVVLSSGAIFCLAALTTIVSVSWTANSIIRDFHNPRVPEVLKRELGAAIYIGFVTSGLLFCGGAILCTSCPPHRDRLPSSGYTLAKTPTRSSYAIKNYV